MADDEYVPRRLRRFEREGFSGGDKKLREKSTEIAIGKVDEFRKKHDRYPNEGELEEISGTIFEQLKREEESEKLREKELKKIRDSMEIDLGEPKAESGGASVLEERRSRRGSRRHELNREEKKEAPEKKAIEKDSKSAGKKKAEELKNPEPAKAPPAEGKKILTREEFFGKSAQEKPAQDIKKLAEIDELASLEKDMNDDGFDVVEKETNANNSGCPNCGNKAGTIIYCPECGQAFCDHCAKGVEVQNDAVKYTCPKCGAQFKKRKQ